MLDNPELTIMQFRKTLKIKTRFIPSFKTYLLNNYYVPGIVLDAGTILFWCLHLRVDSLSYVSGCGL